jgi:hypothetical protein
VRAITGTSPPVWPSASFEGGPHGVFNIELSSELG